MVDGRRRCLPVGKSYQGSGSILLQLGDRGKLGVVKIGVKVKTGAGRGRVIERGEGDWVVEVKARPERGKANAEVVRLVADCLEISRSKVVIIQGLKSRKKVLEINE